MLEILGQSHSSFLVELSVLTTSPLPEVSEMASNKLFSVPQGPIPPPLHGPRYTLSDFTCGRLQGGANTYCTYVDELRFFNTNQKSWFTIPCYVSPVKLLRYGWDVEENMTCTSLAALVLLSHFSLHSPPSARSQNKRMVEERQTGERDGRAGCLTFAPIRRIVASASVRPFVLNCAEANPETLL